MGDSDPFVAHPWSKRPGQMTKPPVFALVDCNNFFVSCERVFRPDLRGQPVVVLSNNDGCIIARSAEVKALGVPMAAPYFKHRDLLNQHKTAVFSANFPLYGNLSQRVTTILKDLIPDIEIYSVDESFLEISTLPIADYQRWALGVAATIERWTGIPVSVGVAPTKTLAKLAASQVKHEQGSKGALSLMGEPALTRQVLQNRPLSDIWGIGHRWAAKLRGYGLRTAYDLTQVRDEWGLEQLTIRGLRTIFELRGFSQISLDQTDPPQQSISATRMFGHTVRSLSELEAAVADFTVRAAYKLRQDRSFCWEATVYLKRHVEAGPRYLYKSVLLPAPASDNATLIKSTLSALYQLYDPDFGYQKAGVILTKLVPDSAQQLNLFAPMSQNQLARQERLSRTVDALNTRYGPNTVQQAVQRAGERSHWQSKRQHQSPAYLTDWYQLPKVVA